MKLTIKGNSKKESVILEGGHFKQQLRIQQEKYSFCKMLIQKQHLRLILSMKQQQLGLLMTIFEFYWDQKGRVERSRETYFNKQQAIE
ncbi:unnamed protein product [Paramecium octaurelia]|uniref:Uncharacterized protein n=1 Tax=Paramecium octaurelia TaxID=43137 RepID=A0A8S1X7R2_PAROT|nr:unnamed protein product [Paramecium octaurelia]